MKALRIKRLYFNQIRSGVKTLEARVAYPDIKAIRAGHKIQFECGDDSLVKTVKAVRTYKSVALMLDNEPLSQLLPNTNKQEAESAYNSIYSPEKVKGLGGMVVLELV
jgi:ASC-1-like (ASCH) protein